MISSINSANSAMSMMTMRSTQGQPPPPEKDIFQISDTDGDGLVSGTELEPLIGGIAETTGTEVDSDSFDIDQNGGLSGEELFEMLSSYGFAPSQVAADEGSNSSTMPPPPPVSSEQAILAYTQNSGEDMIGQLMELLQNGNETTSIDITS